jgi:iron complex outermembrane recepter protein
MPCYRVQNRLSLFSLLVVGAVLMGVTSGLAGESSVVIPQPSSDPYDALRRSGISSFNKGALSNIVIRGYQRENLMVTFDGVPYFGASPSRGDAAPYMLYNSDVSRIVVTKGPYNLTCPGGVGGSIEVFSPENPKKFAGRTLFSYGSFDTFDGTAVLGIGNQLADFSAGYRGRSGGVPEAGDGVPLTRTPYPNPNNNFRPGSEDQSMYRTDTFWLKGGVNPTGQSRLELTYNFLQGSGIKYPTQNFDISSERSHRLHGRLLVQDISPLIRKISLQGWWNRATNDVDDSLRESSDPANTALPYRTFLTRDYAMSNQFVVTTTGGSLSAQLALGPGVLKPGIDFYQRDWSGSYGSLLKQGTAPWQYYDNQPLIPDVTTGNLGLYMIYETPVAATVRAVISARGDFSRVDADGLSADRVKALYQPYYPGQTIPAGRDFADWSANAQLFWKVMPTVELFLKGGRAVRLPDSNELYGGQIRQGSNLVGNPFLNQTAISQVDLGGSWAADGHRAEFTFFYGTASDFILPVKRLSSTLAQARSATNLNAAIWGVECEGALKLPEDLMLTAVLSYTEGENRTNGRPLAEIPPLRGQLGIKYDNRRFFAGITQIIMARQNRFDPTLNETSMPGYGVTNLQAGGRFKGVTLTVAINNLFDARYVMPLYYQRDPISMAARIPENGRNVSLTASYRF